MRPNYREQAEASIRRRLLGPEPVHKKKAAP
jgi:hypothetical protein